MARHPEPESVSFDPGLQAQVPSLQFVLDQLTTAVAVLDAQGMVVVCNLAAARMFGGHDLPRLRREPALRKLLAGRGRDSVIWSSFGRSIHVRTLPLDPMLLLEAVDVGEREQLSKDLAVATATVRTMQEEQEELMCACESLIEDAGETRQEVNDQADLIERLLRSNLELRTLDNARADDATKLRTRSAKGGR